MKFLASSAYLGEIWKASLELQEMAASQARCIIVVREMIFDPRFAECTRHHTAENAIFRHARKTGNEPLSHIDENLLHRVSLASGVIAQLWYEESMHNLAERN
jgi:hypothetical protein